MVNVKRVLKSTKAVVMVKDEFRTIHLPAPSITKKEINEHLKEGICVHVQRVKARWLFDGFNTNSAVMLEILESVEEDAEVEETEE